MSAGSCYAFDSFLRTLHGGYGLFLCSYSYSKGLAQ